MIIDREIISIDYRSTILNSDIPAVWIHFIVITEDPRSLFWEIMPFQAVSVMIMINSRIIIVNHWIIRDSVIVNSNSWLVFPITTHDPEFIFSCRSVSCFPCSLVSAPWSEFCLVCREPLPSLCCELPCCVCCQLVSVVSHGCGSPLYVLGNCLRFLFVADSTLPVFSRVL